MNTAIQCVLNSVLKDVEKDLADVCLTTFEPWKGIWVILLLALA